MTKEQRSEKKRLRDLENARLEAEFPEAVFQLAYNSSDNWVQILLDAGNPHFITLRKPKTAKWTSETGLYDDMEFKQAALSKNLLGLACLIRGLVLRYNYMVKQVNREAEAIPAIETFKDLSNLFPVNPSPPADPPAA